MLCHVSRPDSVVMEVEVDAKANGEDCLNKVCGKLGIIEVDYFGLQYTGCKGESLWLNLRNRISQQMDSLTPCRLRLRVKFFVEPHLILQEQTRNMFFMHVKEELLRGRLQTGPEQAEELSALLAQAEFGDYNQNTAKYFYSELCRKEPTPAVMSSIINRHKALAGAGPGSVRYQALQLVSLLEHYGVEWHWVRDGGGQKMAVGVGPEGVFVCKEDLSLINRVAYPVIQMATQSGKNVYLTVTRDTSKSAVLLFKLMSTRAASGLYRAITEMHAFYRCDTVTSAVMMQYSRDFKGHLASLFLNENVSLGKKYVFDVRRTSKEAYEQARRVLYHAGTADLVSWAGQGSPTHASPHGMEGCSGCAQSRALQDRLERLREALLCMLCCEDDIDSAFCPCGHMVCCQSCASHLQSCPVCRSDVDHVQHVYLPACAGLAAPAGSSGARTTARREPASARSRTHAAGEESAPEKMCGT